MNRKHAIRLRQLIEKAMGSLSDKEASEAPELMTRLIGVRKGTAVRSIPAGTRVYWNGRILKATVTCWDREDQDPDHAPELWQEIRYCNGIRIISDPITVAEAFSKGESGWWDGTTWISTIDANVWTPAQNPLAWEKKGAKNEN